MLDILLDDIVDRFVEFCGDYYEIEVDRAAVAHVVAHRPLTDAEVRALNPQLPVAMAHEDLVAIGYPVAAPQRMPGCVLHRSVARERRRPESAGPWCRRLRKSPVPPSPSWICTRWCAVPCAPSPVCCAGRAMCAGESNPCACPRRARSEPDYPPARGFVHASTSATCSATLQSSSSTSQFVRWINVSTSRSCRARSSACRRSSATGSAGIIFNSDRSCRYPR